MLRLPEYHAVLALAPQLRILHQTHKEQRPFDLTPEQQRMLQAILANPSTLILKGRQISASTLVCLVDALVALLNPGIKVAIACDNQTKANDLLTKARNFLIQMGIELEIDHTKRVKLSHNGSEIVAVSTFGGETTEESSVGRSASYQFIHMSELPYWSNQKAYGALLATSSGAPVVIESTAKRSGDLFHRLWKDEENGFTKLFFSVNEHHAYRKRADRISDARWAELQQLGATNRKTASWWDAQLRATGGDETTMLRDYPFRPEHPFVNNAERHIKVDPQIRPHTAWAKDKTVKVFAARHEAPRTIMAVDPAGGGGNGDNAVIALLNSDNKQIVATWCSNITTMQPQVELINKLYDEYKPHTVLVEANGMGQAWIDLLKTRGVPVTEVQTDSASKELGLDLVKWAIEAGEVSGPSELEWEAQHMHYKRGKAAGPKDMLMCLGFALIHLQKHGQTKAPAKTPDVYVPPDLQPTSFF